MLDAAINKSGEYSRLSREANSRGLFGVAVGLFAGNMAWVPPVPAWWNWLRSHYNANLHAYINSLAACLD